MNGTSPDSTRQLSKAIFVLQLCLAAQIAKAATNHVTNLNDSGLGSLRDAISGSSPGDTVDFQGPSGSIVLTSGQLNIGVDLTIIGPGQDNLMIKGRADFTTAGIRVLNVAAVTANISGLTIANGYTNDAPGGGIYNAGTLTLTDCTLVNNICSEASNGGLIEGGGIYNAGGTLVVNRCSFRTNAVASAAGHGSLPAGGAVYNSGGVVTLHNSSLSDNSASSSQNVPAYGGALFNNAGTFAINNCTLSGNYARNLTFQSVASGGAIYNGGALSVSNSTIAGNSTQYAPSQQGSGIFQASGTLNLQSTIVASNTAFNSATSSGPDVYGLIASQGFNLIGQTNGSSGWLSTDLKGATATPLNPMLGPLANNGGPTFTMAVLTGSPAIDAGHSGGTATDQRGVARPIDNPFLPNGLGDGSDIGAYEVGLTLAATIIGSGIILKSPDLPGYAYNQAVTLTAIPYSGWAFAGWSGDAGGTSSSLRLVMTTNKFVTATFTNSGAGCLVAPSGLVAWWPGASNVNDIIGGNNGTLLNGATFAPGNIGTAFSFDGVDDYMSVPHNAVFDFSTALTIEAWIKTDIGTNRYIINKSDDSFYLAIGPTGTSANRLAFYLNGVSSSWLQGITDLTDNNWHHVAATYDGAFLRIYADGALQNSIAHAGTISNGIAPINIGARPLVGSRFKGLLDEISLYNRALSASEIQAIYAAGTAGKCLTPVYITSVSKTGTSVNLSWLSQKGVVYRAQYKTNLNAGPPWLDAGGDVTAAAASTSTTDSVPVDTPRRFYRMELLQ